MRPINFRVWDKGRKQMFNVTTLFNLSEGKAEPWVVDNGMYRPKNFVLEQYTGVDDATGKPIYEGDILQYSNVTVAVDFRHGVFGVQLTDEQRASLPFIIEQCGIQAVVIGNIHENPELLEAD